MLLQRCLLTGDAGLAALLAGRTSSGSAPASLLRLGADEPSRVSHIRNRDNANQCLFTVLIGSLVNNGLGNPFAWDSFRKPIVFICNSAPPMDF